MTMSDGFVVISLEETTLDEHGLSKVMDQRVLDRKVLERRALDRGLGAIRTISSIVIYDASGKVLAQRDFSPLGISTAPAMTTATVNVTAEHPSALEEQSKGPGSLNRRVARCRSILEIVHRALPASIRADALDEWIDELECAASARRPVVKRTVSIVIRAIPLMLLQGHRLPLTGNDGS